MVAQVIGCGVDSVTSGEDVALANDFKMGIHMQTPKGIAFARDLRGQRTGPYSSGPYHSFRVDSLAIPKGHALFINGHHHR